MEIAKQIITTSQSHLLFSETVLQEALELFSQYSASQDTPLVFFSNKNRAMSLCNSSHALLSLLLLTQCLL